ncbi:MAG: hypothetical protein H5T98_02700 [Syntrophomonadaceae bacterium]|nr:hypothetical protein [Syntrophomonadaceae bacterium]
MNKLEVYINNRLNRVPEVKKVIKRIYQYGMYTISPKIKYEGNITRVSPNDGECFFGYYDKSPWDKSDSYILCLRAKNTYKSVAPNDPAEILLIDTKNNNSFEVLATTNAWNVQQGCMLQWLGPDFSNNIIFNDFQDGQYCSIVMNVHTKEKRALPMPVYSVSNDGKFALSLDFSRLHRLRPGYGYSNLPDFTKNMLSPDEPCIYHLDIESGKVTPLLKYTDFANFQTRSEMKNAEHKVNHIMINPSGTRFMVLHRWFCGSRKYTRLLTVNCDGTDMFNLSDDDMTSHCFWKNDQEILAYMHKHHGGDGYYLLQDKTTTHKKMWADQLISDGHPSYSPDGSYIVTDTYPDRQRLASIFLINSHTNDVVRIVRVFTPFKYDNDVRCDLHPRWNRSGKEICFDSVFEGKRQLYIVNLKT